MSKIQDYVNNYTLQAFSTEDVSTSMADYMTSKSKSYSAIAQGLALTMDDEATLSNIDTKVFNDTGIHIINKTITTSDGEIVNAADVINSLIYIRDHDVDDFTVSARSGNNVSVRSIVDDMQRVSYNNDALISALKSISSTDENASSSEVYNTFNNIISSVNNTVNDYASGVKNIYVNILANKNLTKREKFYALVEQFTDINASFDSSTGKVTFNHPSYNDYTGVSPITCWLSSIDVKIDWGDFLTIYPRILTLQLKCCVTLAQAFYDFSLKLANWFDEKFLTGKNFIENSGFNEPYVDIPVATRSIWIETLLTSIATTNMQSNYNMNLPYATNLQLDPSTQLTNGQIINIIKDIVPLKGQGFLTIPCKAGKVIMYRAYDQIGLDLKDVLCYQLFLTPTSNHTLYGDDEQYVGNNSGGIAYFNHSLKDFYDSYINETFSEVSINSDHDAGLALRSSLYRMNMWHLMLAINPLEFNGNNEPTWWTNTSYSESWAQAVFPYLGGNVDDGAGKYYTGYIYNLNGKSTHNPLGNVPAQPTNLDLINIITDNLNEGGYQADHFIAAMMKHLILNSSYVLNNCLYREGCDPIFIPYYIGNGMGTRFKYSITTDAQNGKTFKNFLVKTAVVAAIVGVAVGYVKLKLWTTGLVATQSAKYTSDLVALSKLTITDPNYSYWLSKAVSDRKKLQWVSLLGSVIGGTAGVPDVLDRTTNSIIDLGTTSNSEIMKKLNIVNTNIVGA